MVEGRFTLHVSRGVIDELDFEKASVPRVAALRPVCPKLNSSAAGGSPLIAAANLTFDAHLSLLLCERSTGTAHGCRSWLATPTHATRCVCILGFGVGDEVAHLVARAPDNDLVGDWPSPKRLGADRSTQQLSKH